MAQVKQEQAKSLFWRPAYVRGFPPLLTVAHGYRVTAGESVLQI